MVDCGPTGIWAKPRHGCRGGGASRCRKWTPDFSHGNGSIGRANRYPRGAILFPAASQSQQTWWFPQRIDNAILLWAVANGAIGLAVFGLTCRFHGSRNGVTPDMLGLRSNAGEILKTLLLAMFICAAFYLLVFASYGIFHVDFRFFFISEAASFPAKMLLVSLEYIPLFFIFYVANSIRVNSASRFEGRKEWVSMLIVGIGNSIGLVMILAIQYACFVYISDQWSPA